VKRIFALPLLMLLSTAVRAEVQLSTAPVQESTAAVEAPEDQTTSAQESESKGVIPPNADILFSTSPITPVSPFPEKKPYDQALDELARAQVLFKDGHMEAASDTALEAYDDLIELRRVPGVKRSVIRGQAHQAADVYVRAGIAYIQNWVKRAGGSGAVREEGKGRLEDLRDVSKNYPELDKLVNNALQALS
jgi:hypothetical protein